MPCDDGEKHRWKAIHPIDDPTKIGYMQCTRCGVTTHEGRYKPRKKDQSKDFVNCLATGAGHEWHEHRDRDGDLMYEKCLRCGIVRSVECDAHGKISYH